MRAEPEPRRHGRLGRSAPLIALAMLGTPRFADRPAEAVQAPSAVEAVPESLNFANGLFRARRFDLAAEEYRRFLAADPSDRWRSEALYGLANAHHFLQEYPESRHAFEDFLRVAPPEHPSVPTARFRVGELSYVTGDLEGAAEALESYTSQYPGHRFEDLAWPYLGDVRYRQGDFPEARLAYERALSAFPEGPLADRARLYLGMTLAKLGDPQGALERFHALIERPDAPQRDQAFEQIGRLELQAGRFEDAIAAFDALEREVPSSALLPRSRLGKAEALIALGRPDRADETLEPLRDDANPEIAARAAYLLGLSAAAKGNDEEAIAILDDAIERDPKTSTAPALLFRSAEAAERLGDTADALQRFERLADDNPEDPWALDALLRAASLAIDDGQLDRGAALARRVSEDVNAGPRAPRAALIEARAARELGETERAITLLEGLIDDPRADPETSTAARYDLGLAYKAAGQSDESLRQFEAMAETPDDPLAADALVLVGQGHYDAGHYEEAVEALSRYLDARPDGDAADHALARIALSNAKLDRDPEASSALSGLVERFPESPLIGPTRLGLAEDALNDGRWNEAAALFRDAIASADPDPEGLSRARSGLGWAHLRLGEHLEATEAFGALVEQSPDDPLAAEASYLAGRSLRELGKSEDALAAFDWVGSHHPESDQAPLAALERARLLVELGRAGEAAPLYRDLIDREAGPEIGAAPDDLLAELGWALIDSGDIDGADAAFGRLIEQYPDSTQSADARVNLAESAFERGAFDEVLRWLGPLLAEDAEVAPRLLPAVLFRAGRARAELEDWDEANALFERLVAEFPDVEYAREAAFWASEVALRRGDPADAEVGFATLIDSGTDDEVWRSTARLRRVQALVQLGRWSEVLEAADGLKGDAPDFPQMAELDYARGRALQSQAPPRFEEARIAYQDVIDARRGGELAAMAQFMRGETFFHQKEYDEALREFLKVDVLPSYNDAPKWQANALLEAGKVYEQLDRWADAADIYEKLRSDFPDQPAALEADRRLSTARRRASDGPGRRG